MRRRLPFLALAVLFAFVIAPVVGAEEPRPAQGAFRLVEARRIWDAAPHNAFTDLTRFKDHWYCVFREGATHVAPDGKLRVLESADGVECRMSAKSFIRADSQFVSPSRLVSIRRK